jgi:pilus assembly protein CpaC
MKYRKNQPAMRASLLRSLSFSAVAALTLSPALTPVLASEDSVPATVVAAAPLAPVATAGSTKVRFLALGVGKSVIIDLPRDVKDVLVADPKIANAVVVHRIAPT